jgi:hypothetical protein
MVETKAYARWHVSSVDLYDLTPEKARDIIVKCFYEAQKETFARASEHMGKRQDDEQLETSVRSAVRLTFKEANADFDHPTKKDLEAVVGILARKASTWGTPEDITAHHREQIQRVLTKLQP